MGLFGVPVGVFGSRDSRGPLLVLFGSFSFAHRRLRWQGVGECCDVRSCDST